MRDPMLGAVVLPVWHAAHRLRMTAHDLGLDGGITIKAACYGTAGLLILAAAVALIAI
jgi:fumarate reductase subunit D